MISSQSIGFDFSATDPKSCKFRIPRLRGTPGGHCSGKPTSGTVRARGSAFSGRVLCVTSSGFTSEQKQSNGRPKQTQGHPLRYLPLWA